MLDEKTIEELHSYYDRLPGGICLVKADDSEEILLANAELLNYYQCANWQEFKELTGGTYRGMVEASDYIPLKDIVRVKGQPEANYAYFQFPYRTREGHFNKGNALLIRTTQKGLGDIWSINVMKSKYSCAPGETENITGLLGGTAFYKRVNEHIQMEKIDGTGGLYCPVYFNLTNFKLYNSNYGIEQGDELLRKVADVLRAHFPYSIIAHLNADNFALVAPRDGVIEQVEAVCREVDEMIDNFSITLKAGVFFRDPDNPSEYTANSAFDMAKIACDSIKGDASRSWATYTETMGKNLAARAYVLENFDRALRNGYIKIFYQPVVRTLTGKLCGMEALARWEDPERGRLTPDMFVPVLEDAKLIYKLDSYVVEQVGKRLHTMEDSGMPVLPISVNLSSADFDHVDPLDVVERVVRKYRLPRSYIRIEITESALVKDGKKLQREIDRFRKAGYQCWMDDFGSGYSSFNVLQNFHFDELKIDMEFLAHFTEKAKSVIESTVRMAKKIGVQTLAEGVETKEQLNFLKSIGCEKIQGYYFGKPMPYDNVVERIKEQHWVTETREMAQYYDAAGREDFLTNCPFALLEDDGTKFRYLFVNNEFMKSLATAGTTSTDMSEHTINDNASQLSHLFRNFANEIAESGKEQVLTYTSKNQYMRLRCKTIASCGNKHIHRTELINVTFNSDQRQQDMLDCLVRNIYYLYNTVFIINFDENSCNPIVASASSWEFLHQKTYGLEEVRLSYARQNIHPDDQERFLEFVRLDNMEQRIEDSPEGMIADYFRTKGADGNFTWDVHTIISIPKTNGKVFLYTSKLSPLDDGTLRKHVLKEYIKDDKPELKTAENKAE